MADAVFAPPVERYGTRLKACVMMLGVPGPAEVRPRGATGFGGVRLSAPPTGATVVIMVTGG